MRTPQRSSQGPALVIGYGNPLRRDDGVGPRVAAAVAEWRRPHVQTLAVQQLTPELAEPLAAARLAIFVDGYPAREDDSVGVHRLEPADSPGTLGHTSDPRLVLALARALFGRHPPAWWVTVPGVDFGLGEGLSPAAARGMGAALGVITRLLGEKSGQEEPSVISYQPEPAAWSHGTVTRTPGALPLLG